MRMLKMISRWLLGILVLIFGGINHFRSPEFYMPMMPPYLPWHLELIYVSAVAEIGLGLALLVPRFSKLAAWGIMALLLAVLPANIHVALHDIPIGGAEEGLGIWNWVRCAFQFPLIAWAWWYTRD